MTSLNVFRPQAPHNVALITTTGPALHMAPDIIIWLQICLKLKLSLSTKDMPTGVMGKALWKWRESVGLSMKVGICQPEVTKMADTLGKKSGKSM